MMVPPKLKGIAGCGLKGIALNWDDIKKHGCIDQKKQRKVVCKHFDYHGGKRARKCYAEPAKETARCKDRQLESTGS